MKFKDYLNESENFIVKTNSGKEWNFDSFDKAAKKYTTVKGDNKIKVSIFNGKEDVTYRYSSWCQQQSPNYPCNTFGYQKSGRY